MKRIFIIVLAFSIGIWGGLYVMWRRNKVPLPIPRSVSYVLGKSQVMGFLPYWLITKSDQYYPNLTTLAYFSLQLNSDGTIQKKINNKEEEPGWTWLRSNELIKRLDTAKSKGQTLSLVVFSGNRDDINKMIDNPHSSAENLLGDVIPIMKEKGFSDLNLDVENVDAATAGAQEKFNEFVRLVKAGLPGTLSVDVIALSTLRSYLTDPIAISQWADSILIMAYDYHYSGSPLSGAVAPLSGSGSDRIIDVTMAINAARAKIPAEKIILGIPLYGYQWTTISNQPGSAVIPGTGSVASTNRISELLSKCSDCLIGREETSQEKYIIYPVGNAWSQIFYEDETTIAKKLELAKNMKLGGVGFWALGYESPGLLNPLNYY